MVELALDWELVKWIVVYGVGILAIYFAGAIVASKKIMRQVAVVMHAYGEGFDELALALEDETVTEEEYEKAAATRDEIKALQQQITDLDQKAGEDA